MSDEIDPRLHLDEGADEHQCIRAAQLEELRQELADARAALRKIKALYEMQAPSAFAEEDRYLAGARTAHRWWVKVLGGVLHDPHIKHHLERP